MTGRARALGLGMILAVAAVAVARHVAADRRATRAAATLSASVARGDVVMHVPHLTGAITLDGDMDDPGWVRPPGPAHTGEFLLKNGRPARPHTQARLLWGGDYLYMAVLASDEDIRSDDALRVVFSDGDTEHMMAVSPQGIVTGSIPNVHVAKEIDGTIDSPNNFDEEWTLEIAVPFASLGMRGERGENIGMTLTRCDTPRDAARVCAGWGDAQRGRIVLD